MDSVKKQIDQLAELVEEFDLDQASLRENGIAVSFEREPAESGTVVAAATGTPAKPRPERVNKKKPATAKAEPQGTAITSPMTGIWYSSPSPGSPSFAKVGSQVKVGDVVGLVEAMKVFNEITSTVNGTVQATPIENGQLVQPGEPLIYIG